MGSSPNGRDTPVFGHIVIASVQETGEETVLIKLSGCEGHSSGSGFGPLKVPLAPDMTGARVGSLRLFLELAARGIDTSVRRDVGQELDER